MPHADPSFETVTATSCSSITFFFPRVLPPSCCIFNANLPDIGVGAPTHSVILAGDFGSLSKENWGHKKESKGSFLLVKLLMILTGLAKVKIKSKEYKT